MTKAELAREVSRAVGVDSETAMAVIEGFMEAVKASVIAGEPVYLRGFGTFGVKHRAEKRARNITQNVTVVIPEHNIPNFKPCNGFKDSLK